jgi:hypothetical protein
MTDMAYLWFWSAISNSVHKGHAREMRVSLIAGFIAGQYQYCTPLIMNGPFLSGVTGNTVPWNKCPGNNRFYCNDLNLRSLVSIAMHLNPSTNNKVGHLFQGDNHYCYTGLQDVREIMQEESGQLVPSNFVCATKIWTSHQNYADNAFPYRK